MPFFEKALAKGAANALHRLATELQEGLTTEEESILVWVSERVPHANAPPVQAGPAERSLLLLRGSRPGRAYADFDWRTDVRSESPPRSRAGPARRRSPFPARPAAFPRRSPW